MQLAELNMNDLEFFDHFGVWILPNFLRSEKVQELNAALRKSVKMKSEIATGISKYEGLLNEQIRRSQNVVAPAEAEEYIRTRMNQLKPFCERKFLISLSHFEGPQFLIYGPGDFFGLHRDLSDKKDSLDKRLVSTTLFLGNGAHNLEAEDFQGGQLVLNCPQQKGFLQLPLRGVAGTLIAFRSEVFHEVKPVINGQRITAVGWFH